MLYIYRLAPVQLLLSPILLESHLDDHITYPPRLPTCTTQQQTTMVTTRSNSMKTPSSTQTNTSSQTNSTGAQGTVNVPPPQTERRGTKDANSVLQTEPSAQSQSQGLTQPSQQSQAQQHGVASQVQSQQQGVSQQPQQQNSQQGVSQAQSQQPGQQQPGQQQGEQQDQAEPAPTEPEGGYPPQRHAGAVGLGPEYGKSHSAVRPSFSLLSRYLPLSMEPSLTIFGIV